MDFLGYIYPGLLKGSQASEIYAFDMMKSVDRNSLRTKLFPSRSIFGMSKRRLIEGWVFWLLCVLRSRITKLKENSRKVNIELSFYARSGFTNMQMGTLFFM